MQAAAEAAKAYGLAAVHIGAVAPVAVISTSDAADDRQYQVLYNPEIIWLSNDTAEGIEGSVSMPGVEVSITRAQRARVAFDDPTGTRQILELDGFPARVAQHEIDQVNGVFFLERLSRLKRDMVIKRWKKQA